MRPPVLTRAELCALIPHAGAMCLLDGVMAWDHEMITCVSDRHRERTHPLRRQGRLSAVHAFELGAQAIAVHGALTAHAAGVKVAPAYLAALHAARLHCTWLDKIGIPLVIDAARLAGRQANSLYAITVYTADAPVACARITIMAPGTP